MSMKRSWPTYLLVAGLILLLAVLGGLQYQWLTRISVADAEKARARVREQAQRFASDFNREIQNSYFNFQTDAESWRTRDWTAFNDRYDYWRQNAAHPDLITDFYYVDGRPDRAVLKYDHETRSFVETPETAETAAIRERPAKTGEFHPVDASAYTLFLPIHDPEKHVDLMIRRSDRIHTGPMEPPPRTGHLAIKLDPGVLKNEIIAGLKEKYFGDGEFRVAVRDETGNEVLEPLGRGEPDAEAALLISRPTVLCSSRPGT